MGFCRKHDNRDCPFAHGVVNKGFYSNVKAGRKAALAKRRAADLTFGEYYAAVNFGLLEPASDASSQEGDDSDE